MVLQGKKALTTGSNRGSVLFFSLGIIFIVAIAASALLSAVQQESRMTHHTIAWKTALPIAEAGAEEALAHLSNADSGTNLQSNGWSLNSQTGAYQKQRTLGEGSFFVEISATNQPVIRSRGTIRTPLQTNFLSRTILVKTRRNSFPGIEVIETIKCSGGITDSFDSSDPSGSSNGLYDPSKARDNARFATLSKVPEKIDLGGRLIYGYVATGSGGSVEMSPSSKVGSKDWILRTDTRGKIEPEHFSDNFTATFPPIQPPFSTGLTPAGPMTVGTNVYRYVFANGDYKMSKLDLTGTEQAIVIGKARLLITDDFTLRGQSALIIDYSASIEMYLGCPSMTVNGRGFVNNRGVATALKLFGLPTNSDMKLQGTADFIGVINAPKATVRLGGTSEYYGHVKCYAADLSGGNGFHGDEAVCPKTFGIVSWREVK